MNATSRKSCFVTNFVSRISLENIHSTYYSQRNVIKLTRSRSTTLTMRFGSRASSVRWRYRNPRSRQSRLRRRRRFPKQSKGNTGFAQKLRLLHHLPKETPKETKSFWPKHQRLRRHFPKGNLRETKAFGDFGNPILV